jgi:dCMP deaminase
MILGISGLNGAGKGEVVRFLEQRSFHPLSLSDVIREELRSKGLDETRDRMIEAGTALRAAEGPGVLAMRLVRSFEPDRNTVIDSVRHPAEVEVLRRHTDALRLIWVTAADETRLTRIRARGRGGDPTTLEEQQSFFFERPSWDEYFMSIARMVASRSNCVKRKVGAVIALDRRIVSTGYNGTPRGTRNCNEGGCPRCNTFARSGSSLGDCLCSHGEENAITQAAYHGISVRGGTVFTTLCPCLICTKMIINSGINEVAYNAHYPMSEVPLALLREAGVKVRQVG